MDLHPVDILLSIINIVILFVLLRIIIWRPVNSFLTARAKRVSGELDSAKKALEEAESLKARYLAEIGGVEAQGRQMLRESQIRAAEEAQEIIKEARDEAQRLLGEARERIADEETRAVISARREIAQLATDMAARILKREVSENDNLTAARDFFDETR